MSSETTKQKNENPGNVAAWQYAKLQEQSHKRLIKAVEHHQQGDLDQAEALYKEVLAETPDMADANYLLGTLYYHREDFDNAITFIQKAIDKKPDNPVYYNNLGAVYKAIEEYEDAEKQFRQAIDRSPYNWEAYANLGKMLIVMDRADEAIPLFRRAYNLNKNEKILLRDIADGLRGAGEFEDAEETYREHLKNNPEDAEAWNNLAFVLEHLRRWEEAEELYKKAFELRPDAEEVCYNYGSILSFHRKHVEAIAAFRKAVEAKPTWLGAQQRLIATLLHTHNLDRAYMYAKSMTFMPEYDPIKYPIARRVFTSACDFDSLEEEGDARYDHYDKIHPMGLPNAFLSELPMTDNTERTHKLYQLHKKWGDMLVERADKNPVKVKSKPRPRKKKRIGLLSSDLRTHVVMKFLMPVIDHYDRSSFELFCYSPAKEVPDAKQRHIRDTVEKFAFIEKETDLEVAEMIKRDDIDVLFDLNGHTADARLSVMSWRLAPVQIEWIGYPFTTGISNVDYFLLDKYSCPSDLDSMVEKPLIMPGTYVCYGDMNEVEINPEAPVHRNGCITFGTQNNPYKYTPMCIEHWARVLNAVPNSRFMIVRPEIGSTVLCGNIAKEFKKHGIESDRLFFTINQPGRHMNAYNEIDITLDVFPLTGGTTTCEAMSMGVPVISMVGPAMHQRLSYSNISHVGLGEECCAFSEDDYVQKALEMAGKPERITELRKNLREMMRASLLCQQEKFVEDFNQTMLDVIARHGV